MRTKTSIMETVNVSQFRRNLKQYLDALRTPEHHILRIGMEGITSSNDLLVLSPATLRRMQARYCLNLSLHQNYTKLSLNYPTLAKGINTHALPSDTLLGFTAFFQLLQELLDSVQSELVSDTPYTWNIRDYLLPLLEEQRPVVHGQFDEVYTITQKLVRSADLCRKQTLVEYLDYLNQLSLDTNDITCIHLANEALTEEQVDIVKTGISCICTAALTLIYGQDLGESSYRPYQIQQAFCALFQWVQDNVTDAPVEMSPLYC